MKLSLEQAREFRSKNNRASLPNISRSQFSATRKKPEKAGLEDDPSMSRECTLLVEFQIIAELLIQCSFNKHALCGDKPEEQFIIL